MSDIDSGWLDLTAADGHTLRGYKATPRGAEKGRVLIVQEIFGVNHHIRGICDDYAAEGYTALAPAMFDRVERDVELAYDEPGIAHGRVIMNTIEPDDALKDVAAALAHLGTGETALVGYCWGGTIAWAAASRLPLRAAIGYYGGGIAKRMGEAPKMPVMLHFGDQDHAIPLSVAEAVRDQYPSVVTHLYEGAGHGFNCSERASYHAASAALAKRRTLGLLQAVF